MREKERSMYKNYSMIAVTVMGALIFLYVITVVFHHYYGQDQMQQGAACSLPYQAALDDNE